MTWCDVISELSRRQLQLQLEQSDANLTSLWWHENGCVAPTDWLTSTRVDQTYIMHAVFNLIHISSSCQLFVCYTRHLYKTTATKTLCKLIVLQRCSSSGGSLLPVNIIPVHLYCQVWVPLLTHNSRGPRNRTNYRSYCYHYWPESSGRPVCPAPTWYPMPYYYYYRRPHHHYYQSLLSLSVPNIDVACVQTRRSSWWQTPIFVTNSWHQ